jgi:hypothetical protein
VSKNDRAITQIRPHGYGLQVFGPQVLLVAIFGLIAADRASRGLWGGAIAGVLSAIALVTWQALYRWHARVIVGPSDARVEIRGRFISRVIKSGEIKSAVLYGMPGNQAVAYLDTHDRRLLTLRLAYWTLRDINLLNDAVGIWLHEGTKSKVTPPPGRGLLPFLERHPFLVGAAIPALVAIEFAIVYIVWSWWPS